MLRRLIRSARWPGVLGFVALTVVVGCATREIIIIRGEPVPRLEPSRGWDKGGDEVILYGAPRFQFVPPVRVFFGDAEAVVPPSGPGRGTVRVRTPAHAPGQVRVRVVIGADKDTEQQFAAAEPFEFLESGYVSTVTPAGVDTEGGTSVTITGGGFYEGIEPLVDGRAVTRSERLSPNELVVVLPSRSPGPARLTLVNFPRTSLADRVDVESIEYVLPQFRYHVAVSARLVDVATAQVLDARLVTHTADLGESADTPKDAVFRELATGIIEATSLTQRLSSGERLALVALSADPWEEAPSQHVEASAQVGPAIEQGLDDLGFSVLEQVELSMSGLGDLAAYWDPLGEAGLGEVGERGLATKVLEYRIAGACMEDVREAERHWIGSNGEPSVETDLVARSFEQVATLASAVPVPLDGLGTIVVRIPTQFSRAPAWTDEDLLIEDGVVAGLCSRLRVVQKLDAPVTKPHWLYEQLSNLPNPLAYTSWEEFRRANPRAEAVLLYRADGAGIYVRRIDAATATVLWSGRQSAGHDLADGAEAASVYHSAAKALAQADWSRHIPAGARVVIAGQVAVGNATGQEPAPAGAGVEAQDALITALTGAGVAVVEPMVVSYAKPELPAHRTRVFGRRDAADGYSEHAEVGATHVLDHAVVFGASQHDVVEWGFVLREVGTGARVDEWRTSPDEAPDDEGVGHVIP